MTPTNSTNNLNTIGSRQMCSSWAPATNQTVAKKDSSATPQLPEDDGGGGGAVVASLSSTSKLSQTSPSSP
eukprot:CAMPEP_0172547942 /NCGR_PEP_ID=MMETSP1067-20121228/17367_1 /TAXON_ID=265564 ORGANISM="Thalassiosira punctigera, Strain Tpunct2005C2" /NCGR_SAMPLE_ID=MMETSP1067 /ASSEMBLY_ACC=CAM_ASM_000444 /LENGTH=70 /DNA_ID=CAMNT_0013335103 /DNA_START=106 /DNA_END=315 /DNA_ORIENTATION=+